MFATRFPEDVSGNSFVFWSVSVIIIASFLRFLALAVRERRQAASNLIELIWTSFFETLGYGMTSLIIVVFWLPTKHKEFLNTISSGKIPTSKMGVILTIELLLMVAGTLITMTTVRNERNPSLRRYRG
jgi:hypothetical protein